METNVFFIFFRLPAFNPDFERLPPAFTIYVIWKSFQKLFSIDTTGWEAALTTLGFRPARLLYLHLIYSSSLSQYIGKYRIETDFKLDDGRPPKYSQPVSQLFCSQFSLFFLLLRERQTTKKSFDICILFPKCNE